jgi:hypothetical protein
MAGARSQQQQQQLLVLVAVLMGLGISLQDVLERLRSQQQLPAAMLL